jgi:hypothetical protein
MFCKTKKSNKKFKIKIKENFILNKNKILKNKLNKIYLI